MRKIGVLLTKGGVGKTTTAVNLAAGLAEGGCRVLLIDTDTQGQAGFMLGLRPGIDLAAVLLQKCRPAEAVIAARENLWLIAGGSPLAAAEREIALPATGGEKVLVQTLASLEDRFDFVILDTGPGWNVMTLNVLFYAGEILAPVSLELLSVKGLAELKGRLETLRIHKPARLNYVVPTFLDGRVKQSQVIHQQLRTHFGSRVCAPIRYNVRLSEAPGQGQTIYEYAPRSKGARDYRRLTQRVLQNGKAKTETDC
jgi:chromosome partitioning protein